MIVDCCDGSDEYDGNINCQNRCIKNENVLQKKDDNTLTKTSSYVVNVHERNGKNNLEDLIQKLKGTIICLLDLDVPRKKEKKEETNTNI